MDEIIKKYSALAGPENIAYRLGIIDSLRKEKGGELLTILEWDAVTEFLKSLEQ